MKKIVFTLLILIVFVVGSSSIAQETEVAMLRSNNPNERVAMYNEPSISATLRGEYFDGVEVKILERVSSEWVLIDITTFADGGNGYVRTKDLVFGSDNVTVEKNTIMYEATGSFIINTRSGGQSGDIGPFKKGDKVEVLGLIVPDNTTEVTRPLILESSVLHVKIDDKTGFLSDQSDIQPIKDTF